MFQTFPKMNVLKMLAICKFTYGVFFRLRENFKFRGRISVNLNCYNENIKAIKKQEQLLENIVNFPSYGA